MGSLKHAVLHAGGLSSVAAAIAVYGRIGVLLVFGLMAASFILITILALAGTFGARDTRKAAQAVLAILLGRNQTQGTNSSPRAPRRHLGRPRTRAGLKR